MTCDELYGRLTDYTEGVLDADLCAAIDEHARTCPACTGLQQDLADLSRLCREQAAAALMPVEVRQRIQVLLAGESGAPPARRP